MSESFNFILIINIIILVLGLILYFHLNKIDLNPVPIPHKLIQQVTIEKFGLENEDIDKLKFLPAENFCNSYLGNSSQLELACNELTKTNCAGVSCCVLNNEKCVAGNINGPTFKTDKKGKEIRSENYYYLNTCYGNCV
jgi:hypothetical protein